jgi:hypothetical protein
MTVDELAEAILIDIEYTGQTLSNLGQLAALTAGREPNVHEMAAFGAYVRDAYTGLENILIRFAKFRQVALPDTADWHLALINMLRSRRTRAYRSCCQTRSSSGFTITAGSGTSLTNDTLPIWIGRNSSRSLRTRRPPSLRSTSALRLF